MYKKALLPKCLSHPLKKGGEPFKKSVLGIKITNAESVLCKVLKLLAQCKTNENINQNKEKMTTSKPFYLTIKLCNSKVFFESYVLLEIDLIMFFWSYGCWFCHKKGKYVFSYHPSLKEKSKGGFSEQIVLKI